MTERDQLIDKLSDVMDRENATAFVDRVIAEAVAAVDPETINEDTDTYCRCCGSHLS